MISKLIAVAAVAATVFVHVAEAKPFDGARWVWPAELGAPTNTVVEFRRTFVAPSAAGASLRIAADAVYSVSLNGALVHAGRLPDVPPLRFYDTLPLNGLRAGTNELEIAVYAQGIGTFQHMAGDPGLLYELTAKDLRIGSGSDDVWRVSASYRSDGVPLITSQLGFSFDYDAAAAESPWRSLVADDVRRGPADFDLRPRPTARVAIEDELPTQVVDQGVLDGSPVPADVARGMDAAALRSYAEADFFGGGRAVRRELFWDGFFVTVDLGREEAGFLALDVETDAGVVIDIGHAEHLEEGRIRTAIGSRCFAGRYRARDGRQRFLHWVHRMAGRYIQIHVRNARTRFVLHGLTVRPTVLPVQERAMPPRLDADEEAIWRTAVRTLRLCMHEHYEDCPWREQALYANDARNQMLAGYQAFSSDNRMPELSLELLARGVDENGWIELCMPAKIGLAIPSFTFSWVMAVGDHLTYRHDKTFVWAMMPTLKKILDARLAELTDGLLPCPRSPRYWQFYDWAKDLSGDLHRAQNGLPLSAEAMYEAPLNLLAILAFESGARCAMAVGESEAAARWRKAAERLRASVIRRFWDAEKGEVVTRLGACLAPAELTQALALLANAVPSGARETVLGKLAAGSDWTPTSLSQSLYKYEALIRAGGAYAVNARREIRSVWGDMVNAGATSFWEVKEGWTAFGGAGSLCHGWSAIPVYFYGAYPEVFHADPYSARWNGHDVPLQEARVSAKPICRVWPGHQREIEQTRGARFVRFDCPSNGVFTLRAPGLAARFVRMLPLSAASCVTMAGADELVLSVPRQGAYVFELDGLPPLHVFADPPLPPVPTPGPGGRLIRFEPGVHEIGVVEPKSNDVVLLDEGAVVRGALFVCQATNVTVTGRGVFDAAALDRADPRVRAVRRSHGLPEIDTESACFPFSVYASENVTISGVTFRDAPFWTLVVRNHCRNTLIDNIHIIGNWRYNSDGVDICASAGTEIRNSFFRTFDDCVIARGPYLKGETRPVSDMIVSNCTMYCDWGAVVKAQVQDLHGSTIENVLVKDCRFVASQDFGFYLAVRYGCDLDVIRNFTAEDIEFDFFPQSESQYQTRDGELFQDRPLPFTTLVQVFSYTLGRNLDNQINAPMEDPAYYRFIQEGLCFRRFKAFGEPRRAKVVLETKVPRHEIRGVVLEDLPPYELVTKGNVTDVKTDVAALSDADRNMSTEMNTEKVSASRDAVDGVRILFLGNSITLHGIKPQIGWTNVWGMAASAAERDFVHLVTQGLERKTGRKASVRVRNLANFERGFESWRVEDELRDLKDFFPDYLIVALGENVRALSTESDVEAFRDSFTRLMEWLCPPHGHVPATVVRGVFWPNPTKDGILKSVADKHGARFVRADVANEPNMMAIGLFDHPGVARHPGDAGMAEIASRILAGFGISQKVN